MPYVAGHEKFDLNVRLAKLPSCREFVDTGNMHRVIKQHLDDFKSRFSLTNNDSKDFEAFVNYCLLRSYSGDTVVPDTLVYEGDDPGIDGVLFFIDDAYVASSEELAEVFKKVKRDADVVIVATQCKTSEGWDKGQINTFQSGLVDFLREESTYPQSEYLAERKEMFDAVIKNVGRIRGGKPRLHAFFATSGPPVRDREIESAITAIRQAAADTGLFSEVRSTALDRDALVTLWDKSDGPIEATLQVFANAAFPKTPGIEESYVVTARATDFVRRVLSDNNDNLRKRIFEENVRDFIGSDEEVNAEINNTLTNPEKQKRFGILNNGVTIVSPDVRLQSNELFLRDFQIVNGCQTSHLLFERRDDLSDDATIMLKVIETSDAPIVDDIVRSTNRQTKVQDDQFLATLDCVKGIERYFVARGADEEHRLFFERRKHQYWEESTPAIRIFDIREVARCTGAMFFDRPELAARYPNRLTGELSSLVFRTENVEDIYYTSAYASYRLQLHFSNNRLDPRYRRFKWHLMMAVKYYVVGAGAPQTTSHKIRNACKSIDTFMGDGDQPTIERLRDLCALLEPIADISRDRLKGQQFTQEFKTKVLSFR